MRWVASYLPPPAIFRKNVEIIRYRINEAGLNHGSVWQRETSILPLLGVGSHKTWRGCKLVSMNEDDAFCEHTQVNGRRRGG